MKLITGLHDVGEVVADRECMIETKDGAFERTGQGQVFPEVLRILTLTDPDDQFGGPSRPGGGSVCAVVGHDETSQGCLPSFLAARHGGIHSYVRACEDETGSSLAAADQVLFAFVQRQGCYGQRRCLPWRFSDPELFETVPRIFDFAVVP